MAKTAAQLAYNLVYMAKWRAANPEKNRAINDTWRRRHPDKKRAKDAAYRAQHPDRVGVWKKANRAKVIAQLASRRAAKLRATPAWLTVAQLRDIDIKYECASAFGLEVDHIVPLRGKTVCGLHVPWNMQYLSRSENIHKGNRLTP